MPKGKKDETLLEYARRVGAEIEKWPKWKRDAIRAVFDRLEKPEPRERRHASQEWA